MINEDIFKKSNFFVRTYITILRILFRVLGRVSKRAAERLALTIFLTPPRPKASPSEIRFEKKGKIENILVGNKSLQLLRHGNGTRTALIIHGWGSRSTHLYTYSEAMIEAGYTVISVDGPAHGKSTGSSTDMMEYAQAIVAVERHVGKIDVVIGHSFGAGCILLGVNRFGFNPEKIVLISCFADAIYITQQFADFFRINRETISGMRKLLEKIYNCEWTWENIAPELLIKNIKQDILIIHDKNDTEVPFEHARRLKKSHGSAEVYQTERKGHRKILRYKPAAQAVVNFL